MKVTERRLKKIIKEVLEGSPIYSSDPPVINNTKLAAIENAMLDLDKTISDLKKDADYAANTNGDLKAADMYDVDMIQLQDVRDHVQYLIDNGQSAPQGLKNRIGRFDTIVREMIPHDIYYWIFPELGQ
jgi:hypothetical protein